MNKNSAIYNLGMVEGALTVMASMIHDTLLSGYSDGKLDFNATTEYLSSSLNNVYNYVVSQADDSLFNYLEGFQPGRKEDADDGE